MSKLRQTSIDQLKQREFDVLIVGAGINGAVAAASLAARGVSVALIDRGDFAGFTSSNSSNLAWGGIKYLENHEYFLVNKLCQSRNHLMRSYPSTVKEIRFLTSIQRGFRFPPFMVYLGTLLYWLLGRFFTQAPKYLSAKDIGRREPAINVDDVVGGFEYSDCYLYDNDARFVFNFVRGSLNHGASVANYVESLSTVATSGQWTTQVRDLVSGQCFSIRSKVFINACGPFVDGHNQKVGEKTEHSHVFSKGIHLIVDKIGDYNRVLTFFASDGRLFFVIPMGSKTCIGTTDTQVDSPFSEVTEADQAFVLANANRLLNLPNPLTAADVIATRCGVRPLAIKGQGGIADWTQLSRKHAIDVNYDKNHLSIFGGKLTDCINVGEEVAAIVKTMGIDCPYDKAVWYGEPSDSVKREFFHQAALMGLDKLTPATSSEPLSQRFWRRYASSACDMLEAIREDPSQGELLIENAEYLRCEIEHAARREMIVTLEDFLRRRSKISLMVSNDQLKTAPGLKQACEILFGDEAESKLQEYFTS